MSYPSIVHHGGVEDITGSCHQLCLDEFNSLLIDCGSLLSAVSQDEAAIDFSTDTLRALVVTHVHADHVGRIPALLVAGYAGPILCSEPSARMLPLVLADIFKLEFRYEKHQVERILSEVQKRTIALPFDIWFTLVKTTTLICSVRLQRAGHILGSAYVECDVQYLLDKRERRIVFSGDLGSSNSQILQRPVPPERADVMVLESTYGNRLHEGRETRQARLTQVIDKALADHGTLLIPAFSIGRTQELLYEIEDILRGKSLLSDVTEGGQPGLGETAQPIDWPQLPIILDSPMASRFTDIYQEFDDYWNSAAQERQAHGRAPLGFRQLITIDSHDKHLQTVNYLARTGRPAIVIAGSGMCSGGRIVNYLKAMLGDSRHNVIFVGYQAKGSPGAAIQKHGPQGGYVDLDRERIVVKAGITTVGGYSAHADQQELVDFVTGMEVWPEEIRLVHGESEAKKVLGSVLERQYILEQRELRLLI